MFSRPVYKLGAAYCGGGATLLFLDQYFEGPTAYFLSIAGIILVLFGIVTILRKNTIS